MVRFRAQRVGLAAEFLREHFDSHVAMLTGRLKQKLDRLVEAIDREFGTTASLEVPPGGLYAWVRFPESVDAPALAAAAGKAGVAINAGTEWAVVADEGRHAIRLCFGIVTEREIDEGIAELARVCHEAFGVPARSANRPNAVTA